MYCDPNCVLAGSSTVQRCDPKKTMRSASALSDS